jgi:hypothetical protein
MLGEARGQIAMDGNGIWIDIREVDIASSSRLTGKPEVIRGGIPIASTHFRPLRQEKYGWKMSDASSSPEA